MMETLFLTLLGCLFGSFLNVVIHRLPRAVEAGMPILETLMWPGSTAPCCGRRLTWTENIPVLSWLAQGGRCRGCGLPINPRYLFVEIVTGIWFGVVGYVFGLTPIAVLYLLMGLLVIPLFFIDLETFLLPDCLTLTLLGIGFLGSVYHISPVALADAILGAVLGFCVPWVFNAAFRLIRHKEGLGGGDVKLLAAIGAWVGWQSIIPILTIASVVALVVVAGVLLIGRSKPNMQQMLPFGPFLIVANVLVLTFGPLPLGF